MQNSGNSLNSLNSLTSLTERIKTKTEQDRQTIEKLTREQFTALEQNLISSSKNALHTTETAILHQLTTLEQNVTSRYKILNKALTWRCLQSLLLGLCIIIGISLGIGGLVALAEKKIISLHNQISELTDHKHTIEQTVTQLQSKTWGLTLMENEQGRFIVLPAKTTANTGWTIGKRPAIKLE